jgi:hypothetical protein
MFPMTGPETKLIMIKTIINSNPMAERMIPARAIFLPEDFMPRIPSTIPTTLIGPLQNQNIDVHNDRIPRIIGAMARPFLTPAGAGAWAKVGGTVENHINQISYKAIPSSLQYA